jgi:hypothetical protein
MPVPFNIGCRPVEKLNYPTRNPKDSPIDLLTFGTVPVRDLVPFCLLLKHNNCRPIS